MTKTLTVESWCEALESGKYEQGTGQLRCDNAFCCLGVACDLSGVGKWTTTTISTAYDFGALHDGLPPDAVVRLLKLNTDQGDFDHESLPTALAEEIKAVIPEDEEIPNCLTALNDLGVPFPLIAKVIRARPKGLFREEAQ